MRLQGAVFDVPDTLLDREGRPLTGLMPFLSLLRMEGVLLYLVSEEERRTLSLSWKPRDWPPTSGVYCILGNRGEG